MIQPRPVLILAGTARVVVGIARCLSRHGIEVDVAQSSAPAAEPVASRAIRNVHRLPAFLGKPEEFYTALCRLLDTYGYDMLIPTTDESLIAVGPFYDILRRRLYPGCPPPEIVNQVLDKRLTLQCAQECGISIPREYHLSSLEEVEKSRGILEFPLLAKPGDKAQEVNFAVRPFRTFDELRDAFAAEPSFGSKYLLQEYCPGVGLGLEMLMWDGNVHAAFQHRRLKEFPSTGGVAVLAEAELPEPLLADAAVRLLRRLNWNGVAMVEFRYDPATRRAVLMEVNGRYWGSLPLSLNAGVEFPFYEWQLAHGFKQPGPIASYAPGFRTLWRVGDLMRLESFILRYNSGGERFRTLVKEAGAFLLRFGSRVPDALWQWRDPKPGLLEFHARIIKPVLRPGSLLRLLPAALRNEGRVYRYYGVRLGLFHTYLKLSHRAGLRRRDFMSRLRSSTTFLFVCSGNIIRSPMAAQLLRKALPPGALCIESAGLFAGTGHPADPTAARVASEIGVPLDGHRSAPLSNNAVERSDIIFVMDHLNEAVLLSRFPRAAPKAFLLGTCDAGRRVEIADPYGRGMDEVRKCYDRIYGCVQKLACLLRDPPN